LACADAYKEVAALKQQPDKEILVPLSRLFWNDLLLDDLADDLHGKVEATFSPVIKSAAH
jgi:hypothetical protein